MLNKSDFIEEYAKYSKITKRESHYLVTKFIECLAVCLEAGEEVTFPGFGVFKINTRKPRRIVHPKTHKVTFIPERKVLFLKPSELFQKRLNGDNQKEE